MANTSPQSPTSGSSAKLDQVQGQVNEVKVILKDNINKVMERGDRLDDLIGKTDDLQASEAALMAQKLHDVFPWYLIEKWGVDQADSFQRTSTRVARKYWWKNIKMMIIIGVVLLVIIIIIILFATKVI